MQGAQRTGPWPMGGFGVKPLRLQGRIEGSNEPSTSSAAARRFARAKAKARAAGHKPTLLAALSSDEEEAV